MCSIAAGMTVAVVVPLGAWSLPGLAQAPAVQEAPRYRLGPGDRLAMKVFQVEGFEAVAAVLPDGTLNLPRIGTLRVWGLTLDQARSAITTAYGKILRDPIIYLDLVGTRPLRVSVTGEVQRPGLYSLGLAQIGQLANSDGGEAQTISSQGWPTLVEAIQKAGGLTARGDLRRVTLIRPNPTIGGKTTTTINYWEALRSGALVQNPLVYDGDSIRIPVADEPESSELLTVASSSFAPSSITVTVVGEVENPGPQQIKANSPLSQAVLAAGGLTRRSNKQSLRLLRVLPNGAVNQKMLAFSPGEQLGKSNNPPLQDGDVVLVDRHGWAKFNDRLKDTMEPLGPVLNAATIFRILSAN